MQRVCGLHKLFEPELVRNQWLQANLYSSTFHWCTSFNHCFYPYRSLEGVVFIARGFKACKEAWRAAYGISNKRLEEGLKSIKNSLITYDSEYILRGQGHKTNVAKAWMELLFGRIGDKMPDSLAINLPSYLDNRIIYGWMTQDLSREQTICYSQFCRIMNLDFPDVSLPKISTLPNW